MSQMVELLRTNDLVFLSFVQHTLNEAGVEHLVLDEYASAVEGSISAIPRRIVVDERNIKYAQKLIGNFSLTTSA
jgi:Putative prokaryotic signal transducing protein